MPATSQQQIPRHVAIIMDGNGRWAGKRLLPRAAGHKEGVRTLRRIVEHCVSAGVEVLTVYAFSSENWRRPGREVGLLMDLFMTALRNEVEELHKNRVRLRFIGDRSAFPAKLQDSINTAEAHTSANTGLVLVVAANYGGRWDVTQTCRELLVRVKSGELDPGDLDEAYLNEAISLGDLAEPDLFIRTGGEQRLSNFLLWQLAYTELYFTDTLWPDFTPDHFDEAVTWFSRRQRRFGQTSEQVEQT